MVPTTVRDEFPRKVQQILAARAGHKCSICEDPTSGPGEDLESAVSDGIAAHITAASRGGPRYDPSLSSEQRSSLANGMWLCTKHGREIDTPASGYTAAVLRGLKMIRERKAAIELESSKTAEDHSATLVEFPYIATTEKLFEVSIHQPYRYPVAMAMRDLIVASGPRPRVFDLIPEVIVGTWHIHPNVAGLLATLLCNTIHYWHPSAQVLEKLEALCRAAIRADDWSRVASVEPLAFALGTKGRLEIQKKILERIVSAKRWRERDIQRVRKYYGTAGIEIAAILRHWNDPLRKGLLRANDVGRLIDLLMSNDTILRQPAARRKLLKLLADHAEVLSKHGAPELARSVAAFVEALRSATRPKD